MASEAGDYTSIQNVYFFGANVNASTLARAQFSVGWYSNVASIIAKTMAMPKARLFKSSMPYPAMSHAGGSGAARATLPPASTERNE